MAKMKQTFKRSTSWLLTLALLLTLVPMTGMVAYAENAKPTLTVKEGVAKVDGKDFVSGSEITSGASIVVTAREPKGKEKSFKEWDIEVKEVSTTTTGSAITTSPAAVEITAKKVKEDLDKNKTKNPIEFKAPSGFSVTLTATFNKKSDSGSSSGGSSSGGSSSSSSSKKPDKKTDDDKGDKKPEDSKDLPPRSEWLYQDIRPDAYYAAAVERLTKAGILNGVGADDFAPYAIVNRAMLVTVLYRVDGKPMGYTESFADVPEGTWYSDSVAWAQAMGVVNGYSASAFGPMDNLTIEQIVTIIYRYQKNKGKIGEVAIKLADYAGSENVSDYAKEAMAWGIEKGMVRFNDSGVMLPKDTITRADLAVMVDAIVEY